MWAETTRPKYDRSALRYASDVTDAEWALIAPQLPEPRALGRPRVACLREVVNAIFYVLRTGCQWRFLPRDFPSRSTVQRYFYAWRDDGTWQTLNHLLVMAAREAAVPVRAPGSSTASRSRRPKAAVSVASTPVRR